MPARTKPQPTSSHPTRPLIGINTDFYTPKNTPAYARLNIGYIDSIIGAGAIPVLIPPLRKENFADVEALLNMVSGVVLSGGMDLDPRKYGVQPTAAVQLMSPRREECDRFLLTKIVERKLPLLAIGAGTASGF
jgi:putative glutamine amidotransferase